MFDIPTSFFVRCETPDIKSEFITICKKLFHGKPDRENPNFYYIYTEKLRYQLFFAIEETVEQNEYSQYPVLDISNEENSFFDPKVDSSRLYVHFCLTDQPKRAKREENRYVLPFSEISLSSIQSTMTYFLMLNECFPYGLHLSNEFSEDCCILLKRLFRSLDRTLNGRISLSDISQYNYKIFGYNLSLEDFSSIFQILHEGDEPAFVSSVRTMSISFDEFLTIMQHLKSLGYGHVIYKLIFSLDFPHYMNPMNHYQFNGKPKSLNKSATKFVSMIYNDFPNQPTRNQLIDLFIPNGGAPQKLTNLRIIELEDWVDMWNSWFLTEPEEVVRNLLAFGFPISLVEEAFNVEQDKPIAPVAAISAALTTLAVGAGLFLLQRRHK